MSERDEFEERAKAFQSFRYFAKMKCLFDCSFKAKILINMRSIPLMLEE